MASATPLPNGHRLVVAVCALLAGALALVMLAAYLAGAMNLAALASGQRPLSPVAAVLVILLSVALWRARTRPSRAAAFLAMTALWVAVVFLAGYAMTSGQAMEHWFASGRVPMRRLGWVGCLGLLGAAVSILTGPTLAGQGWERRPVSALAALLPLGLGALIMVTYLAGAPLLAHVRGAGSSLPMGILNFLLGLGCLFAAGARAWPLQPFRADPAQGGRGLQPGPVALYLATAIVFLLGGALYLRRQLQSAQRAAEQELAAIAELKAGRIAGWAKDRRGEAELLAQSSMFQMHFRSYLAGTSPAMESAGLAQWLQSFCRQNGYLRAVLYDAQGQPKLAAYPGAGPHEPPSPLGQAHGGFNLTGVQVNDLHREPGVRAVHMSLWLPVKPVTEGPGRPLGVLALMIDARRELFPLLEGWPTAQPSAETMLVRREGDQMVYLNELKGQPDAALNLRQPLSGQIGLPALFAAKGQPGSLTGRDYRGRRVAAAVLPVAGTPWFLISQVDEADLFGPLWQQNWLACAGLLGLMTGAAMALGLAARRHEAQKMRAQLAAAKALRAAEERFTLAFATSPDSININRLEDGVYLNVNEGFTRLTGYTAEDVVGRSSRQEDCAIWVDNADRDRMVAQLKAEGRVESLEAPFRAKDGRIITGLMSARTLELDDQRCVISITRDITQLRRGEEERRQMALKMHQVEKLESLGALAGGVAHDMNNVLGAILSMASAHQAKLAPGDSLAGAFETIISACLRGRGVVKGLLLFARKDLETREPVCLNQLLRELVQLLAHTTLKRVQLDLRLQEPLPRVQGDPGALNHAVMNLCVNALDAMPDGGTLSLWTEASGGRVRLTVTDTGEGMAPEVRDRALEPFFTTKPKGKGTGLGLAMVFGTVQAHDGTMEIRSQPGRGTSIELAFPPVADDTPREVPDPVARTTPGPGLRILLVDDDELIRDSMVPMLEILGHIVTAAPGGQEALDLLQAGQEVDLVILDMNMPGLNGAQTLPRILALRPDQAVLLASGYHDDSLRDLTRGRPRLGSITKPFSLDEIRKKLTELVRDRALSPG